MSSDKVNDTAGNQDPTAQQAYRAYTEARDRFVAELVNSVQTDPRAAETLCRMLAARVGVLRVLYLLRADAGGTALFYTETTPMTRALAGALGFVEFDHMHACLMLCASGRREVDRWIDYMTVLDGHPLLAPLWKQVIVF
ncbi:hypothetical protein [Amycolatopsis anabasis]|uniref:hypothetical protein n=1 Tax=Amycolatopsis anabasis TaxID=1840409 RepID=UPI00131D963E|nr:hypothetical protein [Amycolatopsis anabasis]